MDLSGLKGSYLKIFGRGTHVKNLQSWGLGYLVADITMVSLPHVKYKGDIFHEDYTYFGSESLLAFSMISVSDYSVSKVEGKPDFLFLNELSTVRGGFGFDVPSNLPEPLKEFLTNIRTIFGGGDSGVYKINTEVPNGRLYAYNFRGEKKNVTINDEGPYFLNKIYFKNKEYGNYNGVHAYSLYMKEVLEDRAFGSNIIITEVNMEPEEAREVYQHVFQTMSGFVTTGTYTYSIKQVDLFKLLNGKEDK